MRPGFQKIYLKDQSSFSVQHHTHDPKVGSFHYHPELELKLIVKGEGEFILGEKIHPFGPGDVILQGANLPHIWKYGIKEEGVLDGMEVEYIDVHFLMDTFGNTFYQLPESYQLPRLFHRAEQGLNFHGETKEKVAQMMKNLVSMQGLDRLIQLISILKELAETRDYEVLSVSYPVGRHHDGDIERLNKIYAYTKSNFKRDITLEEISSLVNLSTTSFCRYFKSMTKKTYYDLLIETRVSYVCREIIKDQFPIEVICFDAGFNNVSNFYRHFKRITGLTPLDYKRKFLLELV